MSINFAEVTPLKFMQSNRSKLYFLLLIYSIGVGISYALPIGLTDVEWYSFYSYLDSHGATPYVDVREGYPPIGFLIYMPLYYAFHDNVVAFSYGFRALNGSFLVATLFVLYVISKSVVGEKKGLKTALYYACLPSVVIANVYSNDVVAVLPAVLAIYMMQKKKAAFCGILLGLATLSKGFPVLLLIPALIAFTDKRDKMKVLGTTLFMLAVVSFPFMVASPFTYISTFIHDGSRGPWETVWALIEGYHSHGGLFHPYFDKFFYHFNLLNVYPASPYGHAIYQWKFSLMPKLLTFCQIGIVSLLSITYERLKGKAVALCGLLYIAYMLFFQGYSTQFSESTPLYLLLATMNSPLIFLVPLEVSHILQMLSWNSQFFGPEFIRDMHSPLLVFAIVLRSIVFGVLIFTALQSNFRFKQVTDFFKRLVGYLKLFKDKWLVLFVSATLVMALMSSVMLYCYLDEAASFRSFDGRLNVTESEWQSINVDGLKKGDQVIVRLVTNTWLDAELADSTVQVERGVRNQFHLKGSFNETVLFFVADSEVHNLMLRMNHPKMPFRVTEGLENDLNVHVTSEDSALMLKLHDRGVDGNGNMLTMAYPLSVHADRDFSLHFRYRVIEGNLSKILFHVFDDKDEWLYTFVAPENFVLTPESKDLHGHSNLLNADLSLVEFTMLLNDNVSVTLRLDELSINGTENHNVKFYALPNEEVYYEVFIERDFNLSINYATALILMVAFGAVAIWYSYRKVERMQEFPV